MQIKLTKEELVELIKENFTREGTIDLSGIDWGDVNLNVSGQKIGGNLYQIGQTIDGTLYQDRQTITSDLYQDGQTIKGNLNCREEVVKGFILKDYYKLEIKNNHIRIGCKEYTKKEWYNFTDNEILKMDGERALIYWRELKPQLIEKGLLKSEKQLKIEKLKAELEELENE
jgi:hypothetical protein